MTTSCRSAGTASSANPRAEIVGYLYEYAALVSLDLLAELGEATAIYLESDPHLEMHDLLCYVRLMETEALPVQRRHETDIAEARAAAVNSLVAQCATAWAGSGLQPLTVVDSEVALCRSAGRCDPRQPGLSGAAAGRRRRVGAQLVVVWHVQR